MRSEEAIMTEATVLVLSGHTVFSPFFTCFTCLLTRTRTRIRTRTRTQTIDIFTIIEPD